MRSISKFVGVFCLCLGVLSCSDDIMTDREMAGNSLLDVATNTVVAYDDTTAVAKEFSFIYKDNRYTLDYKSIDDSIVWARNTDTYHILMNLFKLPSLVTYIHKNGEIEYFDDSESLHLKLQGIIRAELTLEMINSLSDMSDYMRGVPQPNTKGYRANLFIFDDNNYSGKGRRIHLKDGESKIEVGNLKNDYSEIDECDYAMNDKITSFAAYSSGSSVLFEMFEDSDFKDNSFSFTVYPGSVTVIEGDIKIFDGANHVKTGCLLIPDLKDTRVENQSGILKDSWNDRISSVRITAY